MIGRRSIALIAVSVPLLVLGLTGAYVKLELAEPEPFADRAVNALQSKEVRSAIAGQVAVELVERGSPDLVSARPVVLTAVEAVLETDGFERLLRRAAIAVHDVLLQGDEDVVVELEDARVVLAPAIDSLPAEVADQIPEDLSPRVAEIRRSDAATWSLRAADAAGWFAFVMLAAALMALALAVRIAPDRRRAVAAVGLAMAGSGALGLIAMGALRAQVVSHAEQVGVLSDENARAAAGATWDAFAGGLEDWMLVLGVAGLLVVAGGLLVEARVDRGAALRRVADMLAGGALPPPLRALRGLALAAVGALILLRAEPVFAAALLVVGGALVLLGLADVVSLLARRADAGRHRRARRRWMPVVAGVTAVTAAAGVFAVVVSDGGGADPPDEDEITACNGLAALCDRRIDRVVFPGTHNSESAADRPGWFFANQIRPIPSQLDDGIRLLMIDPHYGVVDSEGRVRTDLVAEGTNRNRVAAELGFEGVQVAERLAGRLGLVPSDGEREIFLCHSLCELGAERMSSALNDLRGFLERNKSEVVVVFVESSVDPDEVEREFEDAGLEPYLAMLERDGPLPTLRELIASGRRVVVFDQRDGGEADWYHSGFVFIQDTRIRALLESSTACKVGRGTPESPFFLMNHWIDRFPPPLEENSEVSRRDRLLRRVARCRALHGRAANLIAVDFYDRGDVIEVARELNSRSSAAD